MEGDGPGRRAEAAGRDDDDEAEEEAETTGAEEEGGRGTTFMERVTKRPEEVGSCYGGREGGGRKKGRKGGRWADGGGWIARPELGMPRKSR